MLYTVPQFKEHVFSVELISSEKASLFADQSNVALLNPKLIFSTHILFSAIYKTVVTFKNTTSRFTEQDFIRDIYINLLAVKNVKKIAYETFKNDPEADTCLKIELLQPDSVEDVACDETLESLGGKLAALRDVEAISQIYGTADEKTINELIQMRGL